MPRGDAERRLGLLPTKTKLDLPHGCHLSAFEEHRRRVLHDQGFLDGDIAAVVGVTREAIKSWRSTRDLEPNGSAEGGDRTSDEARQRRRERLVEAAELVGEEPGEVLERAGLDA